MLKKFVLSVLILVFFEYLIVFNKNLNMLGLIRLAEILSWLLILKPEFKPNHLILGLKKGLIWSICIGLCVIIAFLIALYLNINLKKLFYTKFPKNYFDIFVFFLVGCLISPIAEEIFFRKIIFDLLRKFGFLLAFFITNLAFFFAHKSPDITQFIGGILFTVSYEIEKNIFVPITTHILGNLAIFAISFFLSNL